MELTKALFTLTADSFCDGTKTIPDRLPFTDNNGDFGANFVTERRCTAPISRVGSHLSDRCSYSDTG